MKRVVITGMGIYSCLGNGLDAVRDSLYNGKTGIIFDPVRKEMGFRSALTSYLEVPDLKKVLSRSQRVYMPEQAKYAYVATAEAFQNAGIDQDYLDSHEVGLMYGNDSSAEPVYKSIETMFAKKDTTLIGSGGIFQSMNSTVTMNLSCIFKLKGMNLTVSGACASGSHAIGLGAMLIRNGLQEMVVCGGAQEVNPYAVGSFDGISAFSTRENDPAKASRPFDRDRDGLVPGGGAATVILESYESAVKRGAPILAEVLSYGFSSNGDHISNPNVFAIFSIFYLRKAFQGFLGLTLTQQELYFYPCILGGRGVEALRFLKHLFGFVISLYKHEIRCQVCELLDAEVLVWSNSFGLLVSVEQFTEFLRIKETLVVVHAIAVLCLLLLPFYLVPSVL